MASAISIGTTGLTASSKTDGRDWKQPGQFKHPWIQIGQHLFCQHAQPEPFQLGLPVRGPGGSPWPPYPPSIHRAPSRPRETRRTWPSTGDGFFMVKDVEGAQYFTRAGAFHINENGYLVDGNDYRVQGYNTFKVAATVSTDINDEQTDISLKNVQSAPQGLDTDQHRRQPR